MAEMAEMVSQPFAGLFAFHPATDCLCMNGYQSELLLLGVFHSIQSKQATID